MQPDTPSQQQPVPAMTPTPPMTPQGQRTSPAPTPGAPMQATPSIGPAGAQMAPQAPTPTPMSQTPQLGPAAPRWWSGASVGGGATQSSGPGNDLRGTQINPSTDPRLATTQGQVNSAASGLANGPDRFAIAQDHFKQAADASEPAYQAAIRSATQHAAANGAIGSGQLGTDYGNLALAHTRDLAQQQSGFLSNALEGTIGDKRANLGLLSGLEGQQYGEGAEGRNELRGERGYQNGMENQAYTRGRDALDQEDRLTNSAFGRGLATAQFGAQGNPGATQLGLSQMYGQQSSDAGNSLGQMMQSNASNTILRSIYGNQGGPSGLPNVNIDPAQLPNVGQPGDFIQRAIRGG